MFNSKEYNKQYYLDHKEKLDEQKRLWKKNNSERTREYSVKWAKNNPEYIKQWRSDNPGYMNRWFKDNKEHKEEHTKQYLRIHPEKAKQYRARRYNKRRLLGFNPLNKDFEGAEAHHLNKNDVIYILKKLHRSISHCLKTGRNMNKINKLAMESIR